MWTFFGGKVDLGKSVSSIEKRAEKVREQRRTLQADVLTAIETRNTVIASIGEEISKLKAIDAF
jgi:hypothetical protein